MLVRNTQLNSDVANSNLLRILEADAIFIILNLLTMVDIVALLSTNKKLRELFKQDLFWSKRFNVNSKKDFFGRVITYQTALQLSFIHSNISLNTANDISAILALTKRERITVVFNLNENDHPQLFNKLLRRLSHNHFIALYENLVTTTQLIESDILLQIASFDRGLQALREHLIDPTEALLLPENKGYHLQYLLNKYGIRAMREGLIHFHHLKTMPTDNRLSELLSETGLNALRKKHITVEEVAQLPVFYLELSYLLNKLNRVTIHASLFYPINTQAHTRHSPPSLRKIAQN